MISRYGPDELQADFNLSPAHMTGFRAYLDLLRQWNARINLVGASTLADPWRRHFLDSLQLAAFAASESIAQNWLDLGSGAGFPGLALALLLQDRPGFTMRLVESTSKKCVFLREVIRVTGAPASVIEQRLEHLTAADIGGRPAIITARGFAPVQKILDMTAPLRGPGTKYLLLKGQDIDKELTLATKCWRIDATKHPSRADPAGCVLEIAEASRVADIPDTGDIPDTRDI